MTNHIDIVDGDVYFMGQFMTPALVASIASRLGYHVMPDTPTEEMLEKVGTKRLKKQLSHTGFSFEMIYGVVLRDGAVKKDEGES